jgi:hypothetical protein
MRSAVPRPAVRLVSREPVIGKRGTMTIEASRAVRWAFFFFLAAVAANACPRTPANEFDIAIDEINYDPFTGDRRDEFIEIYNHGPIPVDLSGWSFTEGITFTFPVGTLLDPGEYLVVSPDAERARVRYGIENVVGNSLGRLNDDGEIIALADAEWRVISRIHYGAGDPWPSHPAGMGSTLELIDPYLRNDLPQNWASSRFLEGTPGRPNSPSEVKGSVAINEVRPTGPPRSGFIELYNHTGQPVEVGGWWVVDSLGERFRIPVPRVIHPGDFIVIDEDQLGFTVSLSARYALVREDGVTWVDGLDPRPGPAGMSFGRWPDGDEDQFLFPGPTPGGPNEPTLETDIVIDEILYHPGFVVPSGPCTQQCSNLDQWIELYNRGASDVDVTWWSLAGGVRFTLPKGISIPAGGYLLISADRNRFLAGHPGIDPEKVLGPWYGSTGLSRSADTIDLLDALGNRVDHVEYGDGKPANDEEPEDGVDDRTIAASDWPRKADDGNLGRSLELVNPSLDNRAGAAWDAGPPGGTPLARNAAHQAAPPPIVWDIEAEPAVPRSTDPVLVICRAATAAPASVIAKVEVLWHLDPGGAMNSLSLRDDGLSGDKLAGDGIFGGLIPAQAAGKLIAFQVKVTASSGKTTMVPRSPAVAPYAGFKGPYCLCPVDDTTPLVDGAPPTYRIVMTAADRQELIARTPRSRVLLPCTFIGDGKAFHVVGIRHRGGNGDGIEDGRSYRIHFPPERKFRGVEHLDLIAEDVETEVLASDLFRRANIPCSQEWPVTLVFDGLPGGSALYAFKEVLDGDFLDRHFGRSSGGNLYKGESGADLSYHGEGWDLEGLDFYRNAYNKKSNEEEADYSDIIELCRTFDPVQTPDALFATRLAEIIDADEWARFFAVQSCLANAGKSIAADDGEGYFLYRVPPNSARADAGLWLIIPWDIEETFKDSGSRETLFRPAIPAIRRFLTHLAFATLYWANLRDLQGGAFSRTEMRERFYQIEGSFPDSRLDALDAFVASRGSFLEEEVHGSLTAGVASVPPDHLIRLGDDWRYFKGKSEPSGGTMDWTNPGFRDEDWLQGPTAIGYGNPSLATVLDDMQGSYTAVYARKVFGVADPSFLRDLALSIDYDDGFIAYLNGTEVARRNAPGDPGSPVPFDAMATDGHEAGSGYEEIDLPPSDLRSGDNVLAIQVLNREIDSPDLSLFPMLLTRKQTAAGCGSVLYAFSGKIDLRGFADAGRTWRVEVNGAPAAYSSFPRGEWTASLDVRPGESRVQVRAFDRSDFAFDTLDLTILRIPLAPLGGTLPGDTKWTSAGGPYLMLGDVIVPQGKKLTIGPGTTVVVQEGSSIIVHGQMEAEGTADEPIRFRSYSCTDLLGGVAFGPGATGRLVHVDIESGGKPAGREGTVSAMGSSVVIEDCAFRRLEAPAIHASDARIEVRRTLFEKIRGTVSATASEVVVVDCTLTRMAGGCDAIVLDTAAPGGARSRIEGCRLEDGSGAGIRVASASADMERNVLRDFPVAGISVSGNGPDGPSTLKGTLIFECGTGIALLDGAVLTGDHATIAGNREGIGLAGRSHCSFDSSIVWDNLHMVVTDAGSTADFVRSDLSQPTPGDGNISEDPRFVSPIAGDYSLDAGSPAIGTGKDGTDMGAIPYVGQPFIRADVDENGKIDLTDAIAILEFLFETPQEYRCLDRLDGNDDGDVNISDPIFVIFYLFEGGPAPALPFPNPGLDPTGDTLSCG